jgi:hypothetical protein
VDWNADPDWDWHSAAEDTGQGPSPPGRAVTHPL